MRDLDDQDVLELLPDGKYAVHRAYDWRDSTTIEYLSWKDIGDYADWLSRNAQFLCPSMTKEELKVITQTIGQAATFSKLPTSDCNISDKELLDWADSEGHHDVRYESLRAELADKGRKEVDD